MLEFFERKLKQVNNRSRFISHVLSGDLKVIGRKQKELFQEFAEKGFDALPKERPPVAAVGARSRAEEEGNGTSPSEDGTGYEYLMSTRTFAVSNEYLDHLAELKKRLETKIGLLRNATPQCLKSGKEPSLLDDYKKALSGRKFMINFGAQESKVFKVEAAPRRQHKRTAAESIETGEVLMDYDEDPMAGRSQEDSETERVQKQQRKKQRKQRKKRRKEESKTGAIPCRALDSRGYDRSNQSFLTEEIRKIASGLDGVQITHGNGNRDQNRVAHELANLSLRDASVSF